MTISTYSSFLHSRSFLEMENVAVLFSFPPIIPIWLFQDPFYWDHVRQTGMIAA